jgi:hypothetical protein
VTSNGEAVCYRTSDYRITYCPIWRVRQQKYILLRLQFQ